MPKTNLTVGLTALQGDYLVDARSWLPNLRIVENDTEKTTPFKTGTVAGTLILCHKRGQAIKPVPFWLSCGLLYQDCLRKKARQPGTILPSKQPLRLVQPCIQWDY